MARRTLSDTFSVRLMASMMVVSSVFYASPGAAQQPDGSAAAPAASTAEKSASNAAAGQQPAPQARVEKFDDWYYRCVDAKAADGSAAASCEVAQIATVKQGDQDVNILTLAIAKAPAPVAA